jgi:hypothetical protein
MCLNSVLVAGRRRRMVVKDMCTVVELYDAVRRWKRGARFASFVNRS